MSFHTGLTRQIWSLPWIPSLPEGTAASLDGGGALTSPPGLLGSTCGGRRASQTNPTYFMALPWQVVYMWLSYLDSLQLLLGLISTPSFNYLMPYFSTLLPKVEPRLQVDSSTFTPLTSPVLEIKGSESTGRLLSTHKPNEMIFRGRNVHRWNTC